MNTIHEKPERCPACLGHGYEYFGDTQEDCSMCDGTGLTEDGLLLQRIQDGTLQPPQCHICDDSMVIPFDRYKAFQQELDAIMKRHPESANEIHQAAWDLWSYGKSTRLHKKLKEVS